MDMFVAIITLLHVYHFIFLSAFLQKVNKKKYLFEHDVFIKIVKHKHLSPAPPNASFQHAQAVQNRANNDRLSKTTTSVYLNKCIQVRGQRGPIPKRTAAPTSFISKSRLQ